MGRKRPDANTRFKNLIDEFNEVDTFYKEFNRRRERLKTKLVNVVKRRGRGIHNGFESSINAHDMVRKILDADKVHAILSDQAFNTCYRDSKFIQIDGGPLVPSEEEVPDMGPPQVATDNCK